MRDGTKPVLRAYKIAMDDASRVHIFEPTLNGRDKNGAKVGEMGGLTRIWYKKY